MRTYKEGKVVAIRNGSFEHKLPWEGGNATMERSTVCCANSAYSIYLLLLKLSITYTNSKSRQSDSEKEAMQSSYSLGNEYACLLAPENIRYNKQNARLEYTNGVSR